jgi:hypothetical protein
MLFLKTSATDRCIVQSIKQAGSVVHVDHVWHETNSSMVLSALRQACLPSDGSSNPIITSSMSCKQQPVMGVTAEALMATVVGSKVDSAAVEGNNSDDVLHAVLALRQSLGADESPLPAELANIEAATLPAVAADAVLQTLANPANSKACLDVLLKGPANRTSHAHDLTSQTELLQQAIVVLLQQAAAIDVAVALSLVNVPGGLAALVRSISATNTAVTPITKVAILQLLTTLSQHSDLAAEQLVEHCKVVPILVQQLAEVKVVKGKPAAPVGEALAAARSTASIVTPASDEDSKSRQAAAFARHKMLQRQQQPGKVEDLSAGAKQPDPAPHASRHATAGKVGAACVTAVLQLLQALAGRYWVGVGC